MNYARRNRTLWAVVLCVLLTMVVLPVRASAQATSSDVKSDTTKKKRRSKKVITTDSAAEPASTPSAPTPPASTREANPSNPASARTTAGASRKVNPPPSDSNSEIAAAQASGKVWVNLDSGIYHKKGRWYGKTKNGKFMTEAEAKAAGYKQSQRN